MLLGQKIGKSDLDEGGGGVSGDIHIQDYLQFFLHNYVYYLLFCWKYIPGCHFTLKFVYNF